MTKRFYLTNSAPEYTPPTRRGAWDTLTQTVARALAADKAGTNTTVAQADGTSTAADQDFFLGRWILNDELLITPGTLAGTVTLMLAKQESNRSANHRLHAHLFVTVGDSDTMRGTLLSDFIHGTENPTTMTGVSHALGSVSPVDMQAGDRVVLELGYRVIGAASSTSYTGTYRYGGTNATDLAASTTGVTSRSPWIEFSDTNGVFTPPPKLLSSLSDTFTGGTLDSAKWTVLSASVAQANGQVEGFGDLATLKTVAEDYTWPESVALAQFGPPGGLSMFMQVVATGTSNFIQAAWNADLDLFYWRYNSVGLDFWRDDVVGGYDAVAHAWIRMRESAGTTYLDTSPDGLTWTNRFNRATPATMQSNAHYLSVGSTTADGGSQTSIWWMDNFNNPPPPADTGAGIVGFFR